MNNQKELLLLDLIKKLALNSADNTFKFDELSSLIIKLDRKGVNILHVNKHYITPQLLDELEEFYRHRIIDFNEPGIIMNNAEFASALRNEELLLTERGIIYINDKLKGLNEDETRKYSKNLYKIMNKHHPYL